MRQRSAIPRWTAAGDTGVARAPGTAVAGVSGVLVAVGATGPTEFTGPTAAGVTEAGEEVTTGMMVPEVADCVTGG